MKSFALVALVGFTCSAGLLAFGLYYLATIGTGWDRIAPGIAGLVVHGLVLRTELQASRKESR
ncbi:hypothetical protein [Streptosporangium sp. NPDC048865]|uniref:hypothetical protein n=1 Tax=Streptosporangium sp. NPDC048865 TaxID=3155766 RepID=UPI00342B8F95